MERKTKLPCLLSVAPAEQLTHLTDFDQIGTGSPCVTLGVTIWKIATLEEINLEGRIARQD